MSYQPRPWRFDVLIKAPGYEAGVVPYYTRLLTLQLFENSIGTQEKLRLNLHSLSASELLEYRRKATYVISAPN